MYCGKIRTLGSPPKNSNAPLFFIPKVVNCSYSSMLSLIISMSDRHVYMHNFYIIINHIPFIYFPASHQVLHLIHTLQTIQSFT